MGEQERGHICGNCRWEDKGREDCKNNKRASQVVPYMREQETDDV